MLRSRTERLLRFAALLVCTIGLSATVWAQQQSDGFVLRTDAPKESIAASPLVYAAYAFVWVAVTAYVFMLWRKIGRVEKELDGLRRK